VYLWAIKIRFVHFADFHSKLACRLHLKITKDSPGNNKSGYWRPLLYREARCFLEVKHNNNNHYYTYGKIECFPCRCASDFNSVNYFDDILCLVTYKSQHVIKKILYLCYSYICRRKRVSLHIVFATG